MAQAMLYVASSSSSSSSKAEGDKKIGSDANSRPDGSTTTTTTTTTTTGEPVGLVGASVSHASNSSSGSGGGEVCLFNCSTDELLDLDLESRQKYFPKSNDRVNNYKTTTASNEHPTSQQHQQSSLKLRGGRGVGVEGRRGGGGGGGGTIIDKGFSIDSQDRYNCYSENSTSSHRHQWKASCCCWPLSRKTTFFTNFFPKLINKLTRGSNQSDEMSPKKRYYSLMLILSLIIVSCLVATFVISRSVGGGGDLESEDSNNDNSRGGVSMKLSSSNTPTIRASPTTSVAIEFEQRTIDLIDLIECGKTFAYTRHRIQVRVPKFSPIYQQQPAFLHSNLERRGNGNEGTSDKTTTTTTSTSDAAAIPIDQRFVLTSLEAVTAAEAQQPAADSTTDVVVTATSEQNRQFWPKNSLNRKGEDKRFNRAISPNPLVSEIKPTDSKSSAASASDEPAQVPAAWLAMLTSGGGNNNDGQQQSTAASAQTRREVRQLLEEPSEQLDRFGPIDDALASLNVKQQSSINKTLIDCFMVDTDKRYEQKVTFEDIYRQVASTRKVSFKKMMATITECRLLTWSSLPQVIPIKTSITPGTYVTTTAHDMGGSSSDLVRYTNDQREGEDEAEAEAEEEQQDKQPQNIMGAVLSSWLNGAAGSSSGGNQEQQGDLVIGGESRQTTSTNTAVRPASGPDNLDKRRQGSYFNMASMISGIIPNTLWCGQGDRAANYSELGSEYRVDACCRAHDHCPIRLKPFTSDYGLANWSVSTRSHCDCDLDFNNCLNGVNSTLSNVIKVLYFRFVGLQCIDSEANRRQIEATMVTTTPAEGSII